MFIVGLFLRIKALATSYHSRPNDAMCLLSFVVPILFSAATDGSVHASTLNVWFDGKLISGRMPRGARFATPLPEDNTIHREVLKVKAEDDAQAASHVDPTFEPKIDGMSLHLSLYARFVELSDCFVVICLLPLYGYNCRIYQNDLPVVNVPLSYCCL